MKLIWKFYSLFFFAIVLNNALQLLNQNSLFGVYYNTLIVFNSWFIIPYFLNLLNALITFIASIFIVGYAFDVQSLSRIPPWFFYLRLLSDCTGHSYELKIIQAAFTRGEFWGLLALTSLILPLLPSYIAQYRLTFLCHSRACPPVTPYR